MYTFITHCLRKEVIKMGEAHAIGRNESTGASASQTRKPFTEPKLTFVEPKLTKHGDATKITGSFFGTFRP
jgi:hypothetical protein